MTPSCTAVREKQEPEFRLFLKQHQEECLNIVVWAAFGFKNYAERDAVALLEAYNKKPGEGKHDPQ